VLDEKRLLGKGEGREEGDGSGQKKAHFLVPTHRSARAQGMKVD